MLQFGVCMLVLVSIVNADIAVSDIFADIGKDEKIDDMKVLREILDISAKQAPSPTCSDMTPKCRRLATWVGPGYTCPEYLMYACPVSCNKCAWMSSNCLDYKPAGNPNVCKDYKAYCSHKTMIAYCRKTCKIC